MTTPPARLAKEEREAVEWVMGNFNHGAAGNTGLRKLLARSDALDAAEAEVARLNHLMEIEYVSPAQYAKDREGWETKFMDQETELRFLRQQAERTIPERDALRERVKQLEEMLEELTHYTHIRKEGWLLKKMEAVLSRPPKDTTPGESQEPVKGEDAPGPVHQIHNGRTVCVGHLCDRHDEPGPKKEGR